jgi:hypothetical protein
VKKSPCGSCITNTRSVEREISVLSRGSHGVHDHDRTQTRRDAMEPSERSRSDQNVRPSSILTEMT